MGSAAQLEDPRVQRFDDCFRAHYGRVLSFARRRLSDRAAADDIAAETFVVAWRRLEDAPADALPWLLAIARGIILNELRAGRRRERLLVRVGAQPGCDEVGRVEDPAAAGPSGGEADSSPVLAALGQLNELDRDVLLLVAWDALDHERAAKVLGCSRGAYTVRLHRARRRLAQVLAESTHERPDRLQERR